MSIKKEMRDKIIAYNREVAEKRDKSSDMDVLIAALGKLPYGQLKQVLTDEVRAVLEKYGVV